MTHESTPARRVRAALPPLPAVASRLLAVLDDEKVPLGEIRRLINLDVSFTAEILRLANSAVFPVRFEVVNVLHAISVLGLARVRALVLTVALRDFMISLPTGGLVQRCWRHNLATALASESLAATQWMDKSMAYTAGLMHDVGRLVLIASDPERYQLLLERKPESGIPASELEREMFGTDSAEASRTLMERWGLPNSLIGAVCGQSGRGRACNGSIAALVESGCEIACGLGLSFWPPSEPIAPEALDDRARELNEAVLMRLNMFECEFMYRAA